MCQVIAQVAEPEYRLCVTAVQLYACYRDRHGHGTVAPGRDRENLKPE